MRALTLTQPWAGLVAAGIKRVENRPRAMIKREDFGKPFAIHASREIDVDVYERIAELAPELRQMTIDRSPKQEEPWYQLSRITSAVIAIATVADAMYIGGCNDAAITRACERAGIPEQRRWTFGPTVYVLRDVCALATPVPCRGRQGFWTLADWEASLVEEQLGG